MENTKNNRMQFASLMGKMAVGFGASISDETVSVYFEFLADRSMYQVDQAITQIIMTGERFPSVAKVREIASSFREFKTVESSDSIQIEEFTGADYTPKNADEFFKNVGDLFGKVNP